MWYKVYIRETRSRLRLTIDYLCHPQTDRCVLWKSIYGIFKENKWVSDLRQMKTEGKFTLIVTGKSYVTAIKHGTYVYIKFFW